MSKLRPGTDTQEFKDWLEKLESFHKEDKSISDEAYVAIGKSLKPLENAIDAVNKKEIFDIVQAGVILVANIGAIVGTVATGISFDWVVPVCKFFLSTAGVFISRSEQKTESVQSQIRRTIKKELHDFKFEMLGEEISRVMRVGELMADDLNYFLSNFLSNSKACELYEGFSEISRTRLDELYLCMGNLKDNARKKFLVLKEESTDVKIGSTYARRKEIPTKSKILEEGTKSEREGHAKQCLMCLTAYCNLASIYIMLLSQHKTLCILHKHATGLIDTRLNKIYDEAKKFLAFLPDRKMLAPIGWWEGKLRVMYEYRNTLHFFGPIKRFLGMIGLPETCYSKEEAKFALDVCLSLAAYKVPALEPRFSLEPGNSFFNRSDKCIVMNKTRWPVRIFSGLEATNANRLKFEAEVPAHYTCIRSRCYAKVPFAKGSTSFSSAGIITVGEGKQNLSDMGYVQYIEFALSNPVTRARKIYTNPVDCNTRRTLKASYKANLHSHDKAKSFTYDGQFCIVKGEIRRSIVNSHYMYQFVIEEFNHDELQTRTMVDPFVSLMACKNLASKNLMACKNIENMIKRLWNTYTCCD